MDSILDAAGLGDQYDSSLDTGGTAPISDFGSDRGFGRDPAYAESPPAILDEAAFAEALGEDRPLVPEDSVDASDLSGIDSGFFEETFTGAEAWEIPERRAEVGGSSNPNLRGQLRRHTAETAFVPYEAPSALRTPAPPVEETVFRADPRVSQLPHFELDLPQDTIDPADQTAIAAQDALTGVTDARAGIVQKKRSQQSQAADEFSREGSSTQRPVLIRPNGPNKKRAKASRKSATQRTKATRTNPETPRNGSQVLARAKVVSKRVSRRTGEPIDEPAPPVDEAALTIPAEDDVTVFTPTDSEIVRRYSDAQATLPQLDGEDGVPDETRIERPTGAAALVAWMNDTD